MLKEMTASYEKMNEALKDIEQSDQSLAATL